MALGEKFKGLKAQLVAFIIDSKSIGQSDVESFLEWKGNLTAHSYGNDYAKLITIIVEGHMAYHTKLYIPCYRNEYAKNTKMSDIAEVATPALVPN